MVGPDPLDDDAIERYARQIVIPAIGAEGQRRLLRGRVLVVGHPRGTAQAALYLKAAGVGVLDRGNEATAHLVLVAEASSLEDQQRERVLAMGVPVCWYQLDESGYRSGVHPDASFPFPDGPTAPAWPPLHDVAACDVAALACSVLLDLPRRPATVGMGMSGDIR